MFRRAQKGMLALILQTVLTCSLLHLSVKGDWHKMKIVEEPSSYGIMNSYQGGNNADTHASKLKMRVPPSNFSGPAILRRLHGKCFSMTDDRYKYELCPFSNVTQHEQSLRWNPYSGILGVWQEWEIENNTFVAMVMREGDACGGKHRTVKVFLHCGKANKILNVSEPSTCNYHMNFSTPYVCNDQVMLVYPTLNRQLQTDWGLLKGELQRAEITQKGYNKFLRQIFVRAGYMLSEEIKDRLSEEALDKELAAKAAEHEQFTDLITCREEYQKLKKEVEELRSILTERDNAEINGVDTHHLDDHDYLHVMDD